MSPRLGAHSRGPLFALQGRIANSTSPQRGSTGWAGRQSPLPSTTAPSSSRTQNPTDFVSYVSCFLLQGICNTYNLAFTTWVNGSTLLNQTREPGK